MCFCLVVPCTIRCFVRRRIDFPRPPGHRCASRFSLPDGRDKRGAALKFARFIRHRRRFTHFHRPASPFLKAAARTSFGFKKMTACSNEQAVFFVFFIPSPAQASAREERSCRRAGGALQCQYSDGKQRRVLRTALSDHRKAADRRPFFYGSLKPFLLSARRKKKRFQERVPRLHHQSRSYI